MEKNETSDYRILKKISDEQLIFKKYLIFLVMKNLKTQVKIYLIICKKVTTKKLLLKDQLTANLFTKKSIIKLKVKQLDLIFI